MEADAIRERIAQAHFGMVAIAVDTLAGMIEIRENNHVALLFVEKAYHRRGVARQLLTDALAVARAEQPEADRVTVNSSRHGVTSIREARIS